MTGTCPPERFPTLPDAQAVLAERRARAILARNPHTYRRVAEPCQHCEGAHIRRAPRRITRAAA